MFCIKETRTQNNFLIGFTTEPQDGVTASILSGISRFSGQKNGRLLDNDSWFRMGEEHESIEYEGTGIPVQVNLTFGRGYAGFGLTGFADFNQEDATGCVFIGFPIGNFSG